jgi:hypothetical protein
VRDDELFRELYRLLLQLIAKVDRLPDSLRQPELPPGKWFDTRVAAEIIGCNRVSLQRWCSKHMKAKLPGVRYDSRHAGICYLIHESLVEEWREHFAERKPARMTP